jgi:predicted RNA-binding protein (virulence factor B family)
MIEIGRYNRLLAERRAPPGVYLTHEGSEVLLPNRHVPASLELGTEIDVFVYTDSDDRPVATTQKPHAVVGEFAYLEVIDLSEHGAFLDWGLDKDLFVPFAEQESRMQRGERHVVAVCLDERTQRVMGTTRLTQFFETDVSGLEVRQAVELLVYRRTELGAQVVVDQRYAGLVYQSETFGDLEVGAHVTGYVQRVRSDGKLDISLKPQGSAGRGGDTQVLIRALEAAGGNLALHDNSSPEEIAQVLQMSKKAFKRAVGNLYRQRLVELSPAGITWTGNKK